MRSFCLSIPLKDASSPDINGASTAVCEADRMFLVPPTRPSKNPAVPSFCWLGVLEVNLI